MGYTVWKFYIKRDVKNDLAQTKIPELPEEEEDVRDAGGEGRYQLRSQNNNASLQKRVIQKNGSAGL